MKLLFELDEPKILLLGLAEDEQIEYCAPFDIDENGKLIKDSYVIVTKRRLIVIAGDRILQDIPLSECEDIRCEAQVDCGLITVVRDGKEWAIVRFSMKHLARFSYIARGARNFSKTIWHKVESEEKEKTCFKCGRALPGTNLCPHCDGKMVTLKKFWDLCKPYSLRLVFVSVLMLAASGISLYMQFVQRGFIDNVLRSQSGTGNDILIFIGIMLTLTLLSMVLVIIKNLWCVRLGALISMDLREKIYHKIQLLSMSFINKRKPGELLNRIMWDTAAIRDFMERAFGNMLSTLITMSGALILMFVINWKLTLLSVVFIPGVIVLSRMFRRKIHRMFKNQGHKGDKIKSNLQDVISGIRVVKSFGREKSETERFNKLNGQLASIQSYNETFWAIFYPILTLIMGMGIYCVTYFGGLDVLNGKMTVGMLLQFSAYAGILYGPLSWMAQLPRILMRMLTSLERIYDVLDENPDINNSKNAIDHKIEGKVEFKDVSFGYKSYEPVLEGVNLKVEKGEMIGFVGPSGAGKSTMINLIMRLYNVDEGQILIDGIDIRDINIHSLHSQIGVVLQETFLFSGTVLNNIRFSKPDATYEEIIRAAKMANAHDFICKFPDGYNTYIGESGHNVSGGERQRIAIARAILNNPQILILDEATSSLDTESEYQIQQAIDRLTSGRTTFAIAHRLSTLRNATRLVVIDKQGIAEMGTHNELIKKKGVYYGLVKAQSQMYKVKE